MDSISVQLHNLSILAFFDGSARSSMRLIVTQVNADSKNLIFNFYHNLLWYDYNFDKDNLF